MFFLWVFFMDVWTGKYLLFHDDVFTVLWIFLLRSTRIMGGIMDFAIYGCIYGLLFYGFTLGIFILWFFL
jgi:hypothetical protein